MANQFALVIRCGPILFCVYIDGIVQRLESSKFGCSLGGCYIGCILYADDLVLISSSICDLQKMIDLCVDKLHKIDMLINTAKCAILRFGQGYSRPCAPICLQGATIKYCNKAKYLGVTLHSSVKFAVDLSCMKAKFYKSFNSHFHKLS